MCIRDRAKGEDEGWSYFEGLNKNIAYYAKRGSDPKNKVTADEYAIGITYIDGTIESLLDEYDVSIVYPEDGIPWVPEGVAAFKNAENGDAARYFIEWLFSNDDNLRMLAEIDQKNSVKTIKPSLEGLDLGLSLIHISISRDNLSSSYPAGIRISIRGASLPRLRPDSLLTFRVDSSM